VTTPEVDASDAERVLTDAGAGGKAVRGGIVRIAGYGAGMLFTAGASIALLRYLGVNDFGRYATVTAIIAIVQGITDAGLNVAGQREYVLRRTPEARRELLGDVLGIRLALTPVGVAAATVFALIAGYDSQMVAGTLLAGAGLVFANAASSLTLPLAATLRLGWVTAIDVVRQAVITLAILALVVAGAALTPFFGAQVLGGLAALLVALAALPGSQRTGATFAWTRWRPLISIAAPLAASLVLNVVYLRALLVMMSLLGTAADTGLFATSLRVLEVFLGIPVLMIGAAFPILAHAGATDAARLVYAIRRLMEASLVASTALALGLAVAAEPIVVVLGGSEYQDAASVLRVQAVVLVPAFLTQVASFGLVAVHRQFALVLMNAIALITVLVLGAVLIPAAGDHGAAIAAVAGESALAIAAWALLVRARPELLPPAGSFARVAAAVAPSVAVGVLLPVPAIVAAVAAVAVFAVLAWRLDAIPVELAQALARRSP
jgi:O-antigen/teichoic acid export membrane protein